MWSNVFADKPYLLLDGALGTCIEHKGDVLDPYLWSADHLLRNPSLIQQIHEEYLRAGANVVTTSSYQISYEGFSHKYPSFTTKKVDELLNLSTQLARNAVSNVVSSSSVLPQNRFVAASIGCYGAHLANGSEFFGGYNHLSIEQLKLWHLPKLEVLCSTLPDILAFETIPILSEVKAIVSLINEGESSISSLPCWVSISCKSSTQLNGGESIEDVCRAIEDPSDTNGSTYDKIATGVNCTAPDHINDIILTLTENCHKNRPIVVYPNRGDFWNAETNSYDDPVRWTPEEFANASLQWYKSGASMLGGCCKTDPSFISAVRDLFNREISSSIV
jgi:homocysteine S-methyltransferase